MTKYKLKTLEIFSCLWKVNIINKQNNNILLQMCRTFPYRQIKNDHNVSSSLTDGKDNEGTTIFKLGDRYNENEYKYCISCFLLERKQPCIFFNDHTTEYARDLYVDCTCMCMFCGKSITNV